MLSLFHKDVVDLIDTLPVWYVCVKGGDIHCAYYGVSFDLPYFHNLFLGSR